MFFRDIRSDERIVVSLKGMNVAEIADHMRSLVHVIHNAVAQNKNPLTALQDQRDLDTFKHAGKSIVGAIQFAAGKTFESAIDSLFKAYLK